MAAQRKTHPAESFDPIKANHAPVETLQRDAKPSDLPNEGFARLPMCMPMNLSSSPSTMSKHSAAHERC